MTLKRHIEREAKQVKQGKIWKIYVMWAKKLAMHKNFFDGALKVKSKFTLKSPKCTVKGK